eukprot:COSAG06_NODE_2116_length_7557_cov_122.672298_7_plen_97_part_00
MDALCRELGSRGRADADAGADVGGASAIAARDTGGTSGDAAGLDSTLLAELRFLKVSQLKKRARAAGVDAEAIEDTDDAEIPKEALVALIVEANDE